MTKVPRKPKTRRERPVLPSGGGSYVREKDGSLTKVEPEKTPPAAAEPDGKEA